MQSLYLARWSGGTDWRTCAVTYKNTAGVTRRWISAAEDTSCPHIQMSSLQEEHYTTIPCYVVPVEMGFFWFPLTDTVTPTQSGCEADGGIISIGQSEFRFAKPVVSLSWLVAKDDQISFLVSCRRKGSCGRYHAACKNYFPRFLTCVSILAPVKLAANNQSIFRVSVRASFPKGGR